MVEYRIGGIDVNRKKMRFYGHNPSEAYHRFAVVAQDGTASIYVGRKESIADRFNLAQARRVGGGSVYIDDQERLVLDDFCGYSGAVPADVAQAFAELLMPELARRKIKPKGVSVNPEKLLVNDFWLQEAVS